MQLNFLFGFTAFVLIFSGISSVVGSAFAQDCPGYPNCDYNQTSSTNATTSSNSTVTTSSNQTLYENGTTTSNQTNPFYPYNQTIPYIYPNETSLYNQTSNNITSSNATSNNNYTTNYNYNQTTNNNQTTIYNQTNIYNTTNLVQPLIIIPSNITPSNMTTEMNTTNTTSNSVPNDIGTIHNAVPYDISTIHSSVAAEVNIANQEVSTTSIDDGVAINATNTSPDSVAINVSAANETGPKVILINLSNTTINVGNLEYLGIEYDGKPIAPAANVDAILHAKSTDDPNFAIIVTQTGAQVLVLVPHFSTHTITLSNLDKITSATPAPEFPWAVLVLILAIVPIIIFSRRASFTSLNYQK